MASQELINIIIKAVDEASATAEKVDNSLRKIGDSSSRLSRIPGFDAMKSKLSNVATTIDGKLGGALTKARNRFTTFKNSITTVASNLKGKFGGAIDGVRAKLSTLNTGLKKTESSFGFLRGAASMAVGMIGFELVNGLIEAGRSAINASGQLDYFTNKLGMTAEQTSKFKSELSDMQKDFRKVDMTSVAATASDISARMDLPIEKLGDVTKMTAVMSSEFVRNGRTQEDAVMAVADAMDGQFKRLQEIGITEDTLMKNGWNGDLNDKAGLVDALNKSMSKLGYEDIAKDITTLDEAFTALSIAGGQLLSSVLIPITPAIVAIVNGVISFFDLIRSNPLAQIIALIGGLTIGFGLLVGSMFTAEGAFIGFEALMPGFITSLYGAASGFMAISVAGAPLWAILAVLAALAFAVYEVGIAFGWWSDVGSMLAAITDGATRLWNAFINHPDVQAALTAISEALTVLWGWIVQAGQAILEFFEISTGGQFDVVSALIHAVGDAWNAIRPAIMFVIDTWRQLISTIDQFRNGQIDLPTFIMTILTTLANAYMTIFNTIIGYVVKFAASLIQKGISAARSFVNGIITWLKSLPGKAYSALIAVVSKITSAGAKWVSTAKTKASSVVSNVVTTLTGLPGKIASALSGVADAIAKPFVDAYNKVAEKVEQIKSKAEEIPVIGGLFAAGESFSDEPVVNTVSSQDIINATETDNTPIKVEEEIHLILDLRNVPSGIDEQLLIDAVTSKGVVSALVNNRDFQTLDAKVKERLLLKGNRSLGV